MKILHLIISYTGKEYYKDMKISLSKLYEKIDFVDTFYVEYDPNLECPYYISDSTIYFKGVESMIPGLLLKTLEAIKVLFSDSYNYLVRSNLSTVIDFYRFREVLECSQNVNYIGGQLLENNAELQRLSGRNETAIEGVKFATGTMICLSNSLVHKILVLEKEIRYDLVDDLSIGVLIHTYIPETAVLSIKLSLFTLNAWGIEVKEEIEKRIEEIRPIMYRNSSDNRVLDSKRLSVISEKLSNYYFSDIQPREISRSGPIHLHLLR